MDSYPSRITQSRGETERSRLADEQVQPLLEQGLDVSTIMEQTGLQRQAVVHSIYRVVDRTRGQVRIMSPRAVEQRQVTPEQMPTPRVDVTMDSMLQHFRRSDQYMMQWIEESLTEISERHPGAVESRKRGRHDIRSIPAEFEREFLDIMRGKGANDTPPQRRRKRS
jgi:hypothetical protein